MKNSISIFIFGLLISLILISCESEKDTIHNDSGFSIKFSNGFVIQEKNIIFYDSSTCNFFLYDALKLNYRFGDIPNENFLEFAAYIGNDIIYQGIVYPALVASPSPEPIFIACYSHPNFESDIVPVRYIGIYPNSVDKRNSPQIINSLEDSNLLNHGITCRIDSINISPHNDSSVICVFTLKNLDNINYYIPDPNKMGAERFSFCMGGLYLKSKDNSADIYGDWVNSAGWEILTMDDFSLLKSKEEITYTYEYSFISNINKGVYDCRFYYNLLSGYGTLSMPLAQNNGRIWAGDIYLSIDNITIE